MSVKDYIIMVLSALLPLVYSLIKAQNPDIPIMENEFIELILWIVGSALNGMKINKVYTLNKQVKK